MKWQIPAKTFLLGEYVALVGKSALVLTTKPCFECALSFGAKGNALHPHSPAGLWLEKNKIESPLVWSDPYQSLGGLGASSAQFLGAYLTTCKLNNTVPDFDAMLKSYDEVAWSGKGLKPSGYDLIAQSRHGIVFIHQQKKIVESTTWPFPDLALILMHTGNKLPTHQHLFETTLPPEIDYLSTLVDKAYEAIQTINSHQFVHCINAYHEKLTELNRVTLHSLNLIQKLQDLDEVLAIKGCGALGADVLLIVCEKANRLSLQKKLLARQYLILATESSIYKNNNLIE